LEVEFKDAALQQVESDATYQGGHGEAVANGFRRRMQQIRAAPDERDFYVLKSMHFEKLQGNRQHQRSIKINDQWRLIIEIMGQAPNKRVLIVGIEDYH
jgi:proteic killer suppression protein